MEILSSQSLVTARRLLMGAIRVWQICKQKVAKTKTMQTSFICCKTYRNRLPSITFCNFLFTKLSDPKQLPLNPHLKAVGGQFAYARRYQIYGCLITAQTTAADMFCCNVIITDHYMLLSGTYDPRIQLITDKNFVNNFYSKMRSILFTVLYKCNNRF